MSVYFNLPVAAWLNMVILAVLSSVISLADMFHYMPVTLYAYVAG